MIVVEKKDRVLHLALSNPPVNILTAALLKELAQQLRSAAIDESLAAVLLSGNGKCFSAGASVEEHRQEMAGDMIGALLDACDALDRLPAVSVAMIHGACLGGALELVHFCDFVVADPGATLGVPEISLAFFPPLACAHLPRLTSRQNAAHLILTGETITADRAHAMGLVQKLATRDEWKSVEERMNGLSIPVLRLAKRAFRGAVEPPSAGTTETLRRMFLQELYQIEDVKEGMASFKEKRKPEWKHR
ncbi:MAG: enoyl-CoA hydratase/isomerase family protein [Acidobacteriota bacterium]